MIDPLFDLSGHVVVVTGALGQLGSVFCTALLERGARVAGLDLVAGARPAPKALDPFIADGRLLVLPADVCDRASLESALARIEDSLGTPHGLVNNAGLDAPPGASETENGPFERYGGDAWDRVLEVNAKGPFLCSQVFGGAMAASGRGSIVNICSIYGVVSPDQRLYEERRQRGEAFYKPVAYSASKSALLNLTRYLATYWAERGVRVNTLTFGGVSAEQDAAFVAAYESRVPLGRMADAEEYAGPLVFLLSDASSYMTGANLVVDGGWTAW